MPGVKPKALSISQFFLPCILPSPQQLGLSLWVNQFKETCPQGPNIYLLYLTMLLHLPCARLYSKHFANISSCNPHNPIGVGTVNVHI